MRRLFWQFARFLVVGLFSFAFDYGLFFVLFQYFGVQYIVASTISFSLSLVLNYFLTLQVRLRRPARSQCREGIRDLHRAEHHCARAQSADPLPDRGRRWDGIPLVGKLIATAVVLVYNFISRKLLIERTTRRAPGRVPDDGTGHWKQAVAGHDEEEIGSEAASNRRVAGLRTGSTAGSGSRLRGRR